MQDVDWLIGVCQDLCAYAEKNNLRNVTSAAEYALEVAILETEGATRLQQLINSTHSARTFQARKPRKQSSCNEVILLPTARN